MAKNKTKQAKFKNVTCRVSKADFKRALDNVLLHIVPYDSTASTLNGVKIHVESDYMELTATDGNTMLKACVGLDEEIKGQGDIVLSGLYLSKIKLAKDYKTNKRSFSIFDILEITIKENEAQLTDAMNGITYTIPKVTGNYPKTEELLEFKYDEKKHLKIALNPKLIARIQNTPARNGVPLVMYFEKENPLGIIHIEANDGAKNAGGYDALLMPCQIRE